MLDIGWSEMLVIAVVAILIVGPKDLPRALRAVGKWMGKARAMARDFQNSLDDIAREAELDEIKKQVEEVAHFDIKGEIEKSYDPTGGDTGASEHDTRAPPGPGEATPTGDSEPAVSEAAASEPAAPETESQPEAPTEAPLKSEAHG